MGAIVIADPDPVVQRFWHSLLAPEGHDALAVTHGAAALEALATNSVFAVIADSDLSDVPALELLSRVREKGLVHPFVVLTSKGSVASAVHAMRCGASYYLEKPLHRGEALSSLRAVLADKLCGMRKPVSSEVAKAVRIAAPPGRQRDQRAVDPRIAAVLARITESCNAATPVSEYAAQLGLSPSRLRELFRRDMGVSLGRYLTSHRLERAATLLVTTHERVSEIAYGLNFTSSVRFGRAFARQFGVSPTRFRGASQEAVD